MIRVSIEKLSNGYLVEWTHVLGLGNYTQNSSGKEVYATLADSVKRLRDLMGEKDPLT